MIRDDLLPLTDLLMLHGRSLLRTDVTCARDVYEALAREYGQPAGEFLRVPDGAASLTGVDVIPVDIWERGQWKMTRHNACEFTGERHQVVTHKNCTVLGESEAPPDGA